jgi:hypothetical protein
MSKTKRYNIFEITTNGSLTLSCEFFSQTKTFLVTKKDINNFELTAKNKETLKKQLDLLSLYKKKYKF